MISMRKKILAKGTRVLDIIVMMGTFLLAQYVQAPEVYPQNFIGFFTLKIKLTNLLALLILIVIWNRVFTYFGLYDVRRVGHILREWADIVKAVTLSVLFLAAISLIFNRKYIGVDVLIILWASCTVLTILSRLLVRSYLIFLRNHGRNLRQMVVIGSSPRAIDLAKKAISRHDLGFRLLGFVDDEPLPFPQKEPAVKRLCSLAEFPVFLENHIVDEVFIALPIKSFYEQIKNVISICEEFGILCRVPSNWFEFQTAKTSAYELDGIPILTVYTGSQHQFDSMWLKRSLDVLLSLILLALLLPLILVISLLIKLTSKGPVFFTQERVGYNRRKFQMLKFRTMIQGAEALQTELEHLNESDGAAFKIRNDPRITRLGRWLRKTSFDELPQLINVLRGEMSLVGPRPLPLRDVDGIDQRWQKRRFSMRPGLTCLWQVNGRNRIRFNDWMRQDIEYIDKWSLKLDMQILLKTIPAIFKATGS